jgi:hypothetical protein
MLVRASRTSSSLNGLMMAVTSFMNAPLVLPRENIGNRIKV